MTKNEPAQKDDVLTAIAAGILAATLAAVIHEAVGHGFGCLARKLYSHRFGSDVKGPPA